MRHLRWLCLKAGQFWQLVVALDEDGPLKKLFYAAEDKWYAFWDFVDGFVPAGKIIDRIDAVFPSFLLFLVLIFLLAAGTIGFLFLSAQKQAVEFKVTDDANSPLGGVSVVITDGGQQKNFVSDEFGEFDAEIVSAIVEVNANPSGYSPFSQSITVKIGEKNAIVLQRAQVSSKRNLIKIVDDQSSVLRQPASVSFSCSSGLAGPQAMDVQNGEEFEVSFSETCGTLSATVESNGFAGTTKVLSSLRTTIALSRPQIPTGELVVQVKDIQTDGGLLPGIDLKVFRSQVFPSVVNEATTDASGSYAFSLSPGNYFVTATDNENGKYSSGKSTVVEISSNDSKTVLISLRQNHSAKNKLFFRFVDSQSGEPVEDVVAVLFENGLFSARTSSNSEGMLVFRNLSEGLHYSVVISQGEYVTKIIDAPELAEQEESVPFDIKLEKATLDNSGSVRVRVSSAEPAGSVGIKGADVSVFSKDYNFSLEDGKTDERGEILFERLPAGTYFAFAQTLGQSGLTASRELVFGQEILLSIEFVTKKSSITVKTVDEAGKPIAGAQVQFFDAANQALLEERGTGIDGATQKVSFDWTKKIFFVAVDSNHLPYYSRIFSLVPDDSLSVTIVMLDAGEEKDFTIKLADVLDSTKISSAQRFQKGKNYFLKFNVVVAREGVGPIRAVVRTGLEQNSSVRDENFFITGIVKGNFSTQAVFSSCFDPQDDFKPCDVTDLNAKQVNLNFGLLERGVHEFLVEVVVLPKIEPNAKLELRFGGIAGSGSNAIRRPQTGLFLKQWVLNAPVFCARGTANCPNFGFFFSLVDITGKQFAQPVVLDSKTTVDLVQGLQYRLEYEIFNWDGEGESFDAVSISFSDELQTGALDFSPARLELGPLEVDTSIFGPPITIAPKSQASSVKLRASLGVDRPDASYTLNFRVLSKNDLKIAVMPSKLNENSVNVLTVKLLDRRSSAPVTNALVKVSLDSDFSEINAATGDSSQSGLYAMNVGPFSAGQKLFVKAEAFNFNPSEIIEVPVEQGLQFVPDNNEFFQCISLSPEDLMLVHKEKATFKVETLNCPSPVKFYLYQPAAGEILTVENLKDLSAITNNSNPSFEMAQNDSTELRVSADKFLGEYAIIVRAKFSNQQEFRDAKRLKIIILPKSIQEGYCFEVNKTSFVLKPEDDGVISNRCHVGVAEPFLPGLLLENENSSLNNEFLHLFGEQKFNWSAALTGTLSTFPGATRTAYSKVVSPNSVEIVPGVPIQVKNLSIDGEIQKAFQQACQIVMSMGEKNCMKFFGEHPEVLLILMFMFVAQNVTADIGTESAAQTCEQCTFSAFGDKQSILLGTQIDFVRITSITFDDGGWVSVNGKAVQIPLMGPPPQDMISQQQVKPLKDNEKGAGATGLAVFAGGFDIFNMLGSGGLGGLFGGGQGGQGGQGLLGGINLSSFNPMDLIGTLINSSCDYMPFACTDSCTGYRIESSNCALVPSMLPLLASPFPIPFIGSFCTNLIGPIDVTDKVQGGLNEYQLFVCNKYNDGYTEATFEIKDSLNIEMDKNQGLFVPQKGKAASLGPLSERIKFYLANADKKAFLELNSENDSNSKIATWIDDTGIKAALADDPSLDLPQVPFKIKNQKIVGEEFALLTVEDYVSPAQPPALDIVYIVDSSDSMKAERSVFCRKMDSINSALSKQKIDVQSKAFSIDASGEALGCAQVIPLELFSAPNLGVGSDQKEAWLNALLKVISLNQWRQNAKKTIVIVSDTRPLGLSDWQETTGQGDSNSSAAVLISTAINSSLDQNIVVFGMFGSPLEGADISSLKEVVKKTGGFLKAFESKNDDTFFANQLLKSVFSISSQTFHVRLEGSDSGACLGANDQIGATGPLAVPRVKLAWDWSAIDSDTCNLGNDDYVYCDAVQFTKEIVKRLVVVREKTSKNDFEVGDLLNFKAFLIKDSFSPEFTSSFDLFVNQKEFLPLDDYKSNWSKFVSNPARFSFKSKEHSVSPVPATGLYRVNIVPNFENGKEWEFFEDDKPIGSIEVFLSLEKEIEQKNPFYFMPFDSLVGLNAQSNGLERNNFGVSFSGDQIKIIGQTESTQEIVSQNTSGSGIVRLGTEFDSQFSSLNKSDTRGSLLRIRKSENGYSLRFSPSVATPIAMEIDARDSKAVGLFELRENDEIVPFDGYYNIWSGIASTFPGCNDFRGQNMPFKQPDSPASGISCRMNTEATDQTSAGFSWDRARDGKIFLRTIFFTPNANYKIRNSCQTDALIISPAASSNQNFVNLDFGSGQKIVSVSDLFEMVRQEKVCIGENDGETEFWWNEDALLAELEKNYEKYFEEIKRKEPGFSVCATE